MRIMIVNQKIPFSEVWDYFEPGVFVLVRWSTPSQTSLNWILWFIYHYPYHPRNWITLNYFAVQLKLENLQEFYF